MTSTSLVSLKIPLTLEKKVSNLDKTTFYELVDIRCMASLIESKCYDISYNPNNYSQYFSSQKYDNIDKQLGQYYKKCYDDDNNAFKVKYIKPKHQWGRVFPYKSLGLTSFPKKIRNTLIKGNYLDLDLKNAQPAILYNICISNDILCPILTQYINNRENILNDVMDCFNVDRNSAKTLFLRLSFFGSVDSWCKDLQIEIKTCVFVNNYIKELNNIAIEIKNKNKELYDTVRKIKEEKKKGNIIGSFFSYYLQEYETRIMECVINWLYQHTKITTYNNMQVLTYEFDGLKLLKKNVEEYGLDKLLKKLNKVIKKELGFDLTFEEKPIIDFYDIKYEPYVKEKIEKVEKVFTLSNIEITLTDNQILEMCQDLNTTHDSVARRFHLFYGDLFICGAERPTAQWYSYNSGVWDEMDGDSIIRKKICRDLGLKYSELKTILINNSIKRTNDILNNTDNSELLSMASICDEIIIKLKTCGYIDSLMKQCIYMFKVEKFVEKLDSNGYLLCFGKDIYDLKINEWRKTEQTDYCSRKCGMNKDEITNEYIDELNEILNNIFINDNRRNYFLNLTAELLHGGNIKEIFQIWTGTGRNGKGLFMKYLQSALGSYFYSSDVSFLTQKAGKIGSANSELAQSRGVRIWSFTEPAQGAKLNNSLMKSITGDDPISTRQLFQKSFCFLPQFTPIIQCNTTFGLQDVADKSIPDRLQFIKFNTRFVDNPTKSYERLKLTGIKSNEYANKINGCLMFLLLDRWKGLSKVNFEYDKPDEIKEDKQEFIDDNDDIKQFLVDTYEITDSDDNFMKAKEMYDTYKDYYNDKMGFKCKMTLKTFIMRCSDHVDFKDRYQKNGLSLRSIFVNIKDKVE